MNILFSVVAAAIAGALIRWVVKALLPTKPTIGQVLTVAMSVFVFFGAALALNPSPSSVPPTPSPSFAPLPTPLPFYQVFLRSKIYVQDEDCFVLGCDYDKTTETHDQRLELQAGGASNTFTITTKCVGNDVATRVVFDVRLTENLSTIVKIYNTFLLDDCDDESGTEPFTLTENTGVFEARVGEGYTTITTAVWVGDQIFR